ncbi:MAG: MBL fold metallo-hydrolase [Candidatus Magasanikbacteria bacterium]|nr:MBL fold metallo-hydrolase [Candidatus Magasanikbacteria bacterium]
MHITWLGSTAIKIQAKPKHDEVSIVIDPYKPEVGSFPTNLAPDVAVYTQGDENSITVGEAFSLSMPGEIEIKNVLISAVQGNKEKQTMIRIDAENLSLAHLGKTKKTLTNTQLEVLSGVDILLLPVGGGDEMYTAQEAMKAVNAIEPRIIIPIGHKSDNDPKADEVERFIKEIGIKAKATDKKIIIKKKDLPAEETDVYILTKE